MNQIKNNQNDQEWNFFLLMKKPSCGLNTMNHKAIKSISDDKKWINLNSKNYDRMDDQNEPSIPDSKI